MDSPSIQPQNKPKTNLGTIRSMANIKSMMQKRNIQRSTVIFHLTNGKSQNALILARQLVFTSQKIWKQFDDQFKGQFEQTYFFRTNKNKQLTEYLLDQIILCKIFTKSRKFDDIIEIMDKLELPEFQSSRVMPKETKQQILEFNQVREVQNKICACLLGFIDIAKLDKRIEPIINMYKVYVEFVEKHYSKFQLATAKFNFEYEKANDIYNECLEIRKKNSLNQSYIDVLINSSICLKHLGRLRDAIDRTKQGIQIYQDLNRPFDGNYQLDSYYLFLFKLQLQNGDFQKAYNSIASSYLIRSKLSPKDPKRIQVQLNLLFFYKTLERVKKQVLTQVVFKTKDRKEIEKKRRQAAMVESKLINNILNREEFVKYEDFNARRDHLSLIITEPFFDKLKSQQVIQLEKLLNKLGSCSFQKGLNQLFKSSFVSNSITRELLFSANPQINQRINKKQ